MRLNSALHRAPIARRPTALRLLPHARAGGLPLLLLLAAAPGCGPDEPPGGTPPGAAPPCAALLAECRAIQNICVDGPAGPRCEPCATGTYASQAGSCDPIGGEPLSHDFAEFTVQSGEEILGLCQSWTLNNPEEIWVNAVQLEQDASSHHSNWMHVPSDQFQGPDGIWPCKERGYDQLTAAIYGGVLYAQSTQAVREVQKFPSGAATRIPPYSRVIGDVHILNPTDAPITGHAKLTVYGVPKDNVKVKLAPFHMTYKGLDIPPHAMSRFTGECKLDDKFPLGKLAMKVYYVLPHTHVLATRFFFEAADGPAAGEPLIDISGFNSEARGRYYDPPVDLAGSTTLRFGCEFMNPRDVRVGWGFGDQEMCEFVGFAEARTAFESSIDTAEAAGQEGSTFLYTGDCNSFAFPWDQNKPGGPPPAP